VPIYEYNCASATVSSEQLCRERAVPRRTVPACDAGRAASCPTECPGLHVSGRAPRRIPDRGTYLAFRAGIRPSGHRDRAAQQHPNLFLRQVRP